MRYAELGLLWIYDESFMHFMDAVIGWMNISHTPSREFTEKKLFITYQVIFPLDVAFTHGMSDSFLPEQLTDQLLQLQVLQSFSTIK